MIAVVFLAAVAIWCAAQLALAAHRGAQGHPYGPFRSAITITRHRPARPYDWASEDD